MESHRSQFLYIAKGIGSQTQYSQNCNQIQFIEIKKSLIVILRNTQSLQFIFALFGLFAQFFHNIKPSQLILFAEWPLYAKLE